MPRLDPAVVDLGIHGSNLSEAAVPDHGGGRLLRLPEKGRRRAAEPQPARRRERDQLLRLARAERHRLLAVHVAPRLEGTLRHLVVGVVDGQVDDDVHRRIGQQLIERAVDRAAVLRAERRSLRRVQVGRGRQPDLRVSEDVPGVGTRDVAGADDAEAERRHDRRGYDSSMPYRGAMRHDQIALQLYTVRRLAADDLAGTLRAVAAAGYQAVEVAGLPDTPPGELARLLDGLRPSGRGRTRGHRAPARRSRRRGRPACDDRVSAGDRALDAGGGPPHRRRRAPLCGRARRIRRRRSRSAECGSAITITRSSSSLSTATTVWDVLLAELPPEVQLELDVYWAAVGGRDPVGEIRATPNASGCCT